MSPDPYRTPTLREQDSARPEPEVVAWYDVAVAATLAFLLGVMRIAFALARSEGSNREVDVAWLLVLFAPFVVWKEIAAHRRR